jgi:hypothetical protein
MLGRRLTHCCPGPSQYATNTKRKSRSHEEELKSAHMDIGQYLRPVDNQIVLKRNRIVSGEIIFCKVKSEKSV